MTRQCPTPIEQTVVAIKFGVMDRVSFALERVSQVTVSREQCGIIKLAGGALGSCAMRLRHHQVPSISPASNENAKADAG
jgi:hypothetical protein